MGRQKRFDDASQQWVDISPSAEEYDAHLADETAHEIGDKALLNTTAKATIVDAINEVFQSGNNVKSDMVAALLAVDPTLPITTSSSWEEIETATGQISTGKKWARFTATSPSTTNWVISGIPFSPSKLRLTLQSPNSSRRFNVINIDFTDGIAYYNGSSIIRVNTLIHNDFNGSVSHDVRTSTKNSDGVTIPAGYASSSIFEIDAYE